MTKMRTGLRLALLSLLISFAANAQTRAIAHNEARSTEDPANLKGERVAARTGLELPIDQGAAGLWQTLLKLRTRASLMMIVAHPDDEDGGMLTYEVRGQGVRAAMMTLTRGEGGQNLMTGDFNDALGLIRTQELLAADRYFGTDQMFGTEVDFGFSKTKEESFAQWTHQRVLYDAVRAVRLYRPLVVTSVFVGGLTDGHGHHQVSGEMAQEVFTAAADPKVFPEMGLEPWAPLKVYARAPFARIGKEGMFDYATGQYAPIRFYNYIAKTWTTAVPHADVVIHEGEYSDKLGMTYVQFAREGLALQKTQIGAGVRVPPPGAYDTGYTRYGSRVTGASNGTERSFFDGIDISLTGIATLAHPNSLPAGSLEHIAKLVEQAVSGYTAQDPAKIAPLLAEGLKATRDLIAAVDASHTLTPRETADVQHELRVKEAQFELALAQSLDVSLHAEAGADPVLESQPYNVNATLKNDGSASIAAEQFTLQASLGQRLPAISVDKADASLTPRHTLVRPLSAPAQTAASSRPYFSRKNSEQTFYDVSQPTLRNAPATPPAQIAWSIVEFAGVPFVVGSVVTAPHANNPLWVLPAVSVTMTPSAGILTPAEKSFPVSTRVVHAAGNNLTGKIHVEAPHGWHSEPAEFPFVVNAGDPAIQQSFQLTPATGTTTTRLTAEATIGPNKFTESFYKVGYPGLPDTYFFKPATYRTHAVDVHVAPGLRVAYLPGTGDEVQSLLKNIDVDAATLTVADIAAGKLADFTTLIIGPRAYTSNPGLETTNSAILDFAKNGGAVIVQYQAHAFEPTDPPFPIVLEGNGTPVVEELAKVTLSPSSTGVLDFPNKIDAADFDGWVEERGHGFPASWDAHYDAPTETHDTDQAPQRGGLLVARYGKGYYVYTAFALYRQLPEAVPGAYRLFANLLSLGHQAH
jgi:LmbE family N-acetylglucosaminyl deacetylase